MDIEKIKDPVFRCPHCGRCCGIADFVEEDGEGIFHILHTEKPPPRADAIRTLVIRRCVECKKDFVVENLASINVILRFLITTDTKKIAMDVFRNNKDLLKKLREDKEFMALLMEQED